MIDETTKFSAILTTVGAARLAAANAAGTPWRLTQMGVGDANGTDPTPVPAQTTLIKERRRAPLNQLFVDPNNAAMLVAEQILPADVGGWWIRELGLYDESGALVAVANCPPSFKPLLAQGAGRTQSVRMTLIVSSTGNIVLQIDPSVVLATRSYVDNLLKLYAPLDSPQFLGNPRGPTPARGDNDTSLATTAFVQQAMGSMAGYRFVNSNTTISVNDLGKWVRVTRGLMPFLTDPSALPAGATIHLCLEGEASNSAGLRVDGKTSLLVEGRTVPTPIAFNSLTYIIALVRDGNWELVGLGGRLVQN